MKILKVLNCICGIVLSIILSAKAFSQQLSSAIPKIIEKNGRHALLVNGRPFFMLGGQVHNSSAWPGMLPSVWQAAKQMQLNTIEIPIYWEQIEPQEGRFDFSLINTLLIQARQHHVHLVLLWFATWKNGSNHYMPGWMKKEAIKYPNITGRNGQRVDSPSPHVRATLDADIMAFTSVMRYLKKADAQHTVIMVQVENEAGAWGSVRDYSAFTQQIFEAPVPAELLNPKVLTALNVPVVSEGSWQQVFGKNADEYFHAWSIARFIGQVAAAGKAVYPLPMYVNAALRDPLTNPPTNTYESGGPTDNVIPIWKAAAPAIDLLAPDIYLSGSEKILKVIELYDRRDNPLFVPETSIIADNAKYLYEVIARGGIGFSPFGIDDNGVAEPQAKTTERLKPFEQQYATLGPMMRQLAEWAFKGKVKAVVEHDDHLNQTIELGNWQAVVSFDNKRIGQAGTSTDKNRRANGKLMVVMLDNNKFIITGTDCQLTFNPSGSNAGKAWQYLKVEEGSYNNGVFKSLRILNGDETDFGGPRFSDIPVILQVSLVAQ